MATPITSEQLVEEHEQRIYQLVHDTLNRFKSLDVPQIKHGFALFLVQNSPKLSSDMAASLVDAVHQGMQARVNNPGFLDALRTKNFEAGAVWNEEATRLMNELPAAV